MRVPRFPAAEPRVPAADSPPADPAPEASSPEAPAPDVLAAEPAPEPAPPGRADHAPSRANGSGPGAAPPVPVLSPPVEASGPDVRPYVRTRGRTRTRLVLAMETLVSLPSPAPAFDDPEHRAIGALCVGPRSVAELAALLGVPLGVVRVLVDDMAAEGLLVVHPTAAPLEAGANPELSIVARVLAGLRRL